MGLAHESTAKDLTAWARRDTDAQRASRRTKTSAQYAERACSSIAQFQSRHPDSLRVTVLLVLLQSLDQVRK
jgi:hypothetical protein